MKENGIQDSKVPVIQYSQSISALRRGILKKKNGRDTIHFNADASNTELTFRNIHSVSQLSIHGAVANWCEQFGLTEKEAGKERQKESVIKGVLTSVKSQEVKLLVSRPKRVSGSSLREKIRTSSRWHRQFTRVCELALFRHRVSPGSELQNSTWRGRQFWADHSIMQRIHAFSSEPTIQSLCSNSWRNNYWTSHWSPDRENSWPGWTWNCNSMTQRWGTDISCYDLQRTESVRGRTPHSQCRTQIQCRITSLNFRKQKERNVRSIVSSHTSNKDTGANSQLSSQPSVPFHAKNHSYEREKVEGVIPVNDSYRGVQPVQVSKMITRMVRHYDQDERQLDAAVHWDTIRPVLLKAFAKHGARGFSEKHWLRLVHEGSSKKRIKYCEDSQNSLAYVRAVQGHSGGIPIYPELMGYVRIPYHWKWFIFSQRLFFQLQSILENGLIPGGHESV